MQTGVIIQVKEKQQHSMFLSVTHEAVRQKTWVLLVSSDLFHLICYNSLGKDTHTATLALLAKRIFTWPIEKSPCKIKNCDMYR